MGGQNLSTYRTFGQENRMSNLYIKKIALERQIHELKQKADRLDEQIKANRAQQYKQHITLSMVDILTPCHSYNSCSDTDMSNKGRGRCSRCALLNAVTSGNWDGIFIFADVKVVED